MDSHKKYVTYNYNTVIPIFNRRFILSLLQCPNFILLDDNLQVQTQTQNIQPIIL